MNIKVRRAVGADLERVNELRRQVNTIHVKGRPDIFRPGFGQEMRDRLYDVIEDEDYDVIVAEKDAEIAGFAVIEYALKPLSPYNKERSIYRVEEFGVDESCRRQGVGTALMEYIRHDAGEKGYEKVELDVWEFNENAVRFYERQGFSCYRRFLEMEV